MFNRWRNAKQNRTISEKRFEAIAHLEARRYGQRIEELTVDGFTVSATVRTVSGFGTWPFTIDFNQDGDVTGEYHVWSGNDSDNSPIPYGMAESMSKTIRGYLSDSNGQPDDISSGASLDKAIEIEMARQEGVAIRQEAEALANQIRDDACAEAKELRSSARAYYDETISSAQRDADAIRQQALAEANEIKKDAVRIAEERREARARRRKFISAHRRLILSIVVALILALAVAVSILRLDAQKRFEAKLIPAGIDSAECIGTQYKDAEIQLSIAGFTNVSCIGIADLDANGLDQEGAVRLVTIDGKANFQSEDQFPFDANVEVYYLIARQLHAPVSSKDAAGMNVHEVEKMFTDAGFANVRTVPLGDLYVGFREKPGTVANIKVGNEEGYSTTDDLRPDDEVVILYHSSRWAQ